MIQEQDSDGQPTEIRLNEEQIKEGLSLILRVDRRILELFLSKLNPDQHGWVELRNYVAGLLCYNIGDAEVKV